MRSSSTAIVAILALVILAGCKDQEKDEENAESTADAAVIQQGTESGTETEKPAWENDAPASAGVLGNSGAADSGSNTSGDVASSEASRQAPVPPLPTTGNGAAGAVLSDDDYDVGLEDDDFDVGVSVLPPGIGLPGVGSSGGMGGGASDSGRPGVGTGGVGGLDSVFDKSLKDFDGVVLAGKDGARGMENAGAGSSSSPSGGSSSSSGGSQGGSQGGSAGGQSRIPAPPSQSEASGGGSSGGGASTKGTQSRRGNTQSERQKAERTPEDVPDGDDDDLIARQIREAAENEEDDELREKIWDEYRKYKSRKG